jgi:hypothetical protein
MRIGIFSKVGSSGGSEFRCAEMCNAIIKTGHEAFFLCENNLNDKIRAYCSPNVTIYEDVLGDTGKNLPKLYEMDTILVINSDSQTFSTDDYWEGRTEKHKHHVDLTKIKQFSILYNYVIGPVTKLTTIRSKCPDVRIITANKMWFDDITNQVKFEHIRHYPRLHLESPINPNLVTDEKTTSHKIRIGRHSKAHDCKFNTEYINLIIRTNEKFKDRIAWDFLGVSPSRSNGLENIPNITIRPEFSISVGDYLRGIDIFVFFVDWSRDEPWSRSVAEGMMSGCPVIANNRAGNKDQIIHGNTGYLCNTINDFYRYLSNLIENQELMQQMGRNSRTFSMQFTSDKIIKKFLDFLK